MMSSDPFVLLGLDRATATDADVRRAYAERLKVTRPEDDRAGFMALRAAFEQARERVRQREQYGDDDPYEEEDAAADLSGDDEVTPAFDVLEIEPDAADVEAEDYSDPINRTMRALVDALTGAPFGPSVVRVMAIVEADEVAGIEDYQALQWQVRQLLCDRTGYYLEPQEMRTPDWLTLDVFDALDGYFGWTRQPALQPWVRGLNDWLVRVRNRIELKSLPLEERERLERERKRSQPAAERKAWAGQEQDPWETPTQGGRNPGIFWMIFAVIILLSQVVRALTAG